ncbi:glycoprotein [Kitasatospora sp. NPDC056138]|uniref:glycoprotein n=1 Tax=Kitasatospora sp. NPDC056138 TaxID=3345724 RepID=UPI0035DC1983
MHRTDERPTIDTVLDEAEVLADEYDDYDAAAARSRAERAVGARQAGPAAREVPHRWPAPVDQAAHDLDLAVTLIVTAPQAAAGLRRLADSEDIEPAGALVLGALLHLAGYRDAAAFWWQFAAGSGSRNAAFCLFLAHRERAEHRDAEHWRAYGRRLAAHIRAHTDGGLRALLPEQVQRDLIRQCHSRRRLVLPHELEAAINRLHHHPDPDFGEITAVCPDLFLGLGPADAQAGPRSRPGRRSPR